MNLQSIAVSNGFAAALLLILMINRLMTKTKRRLDDKIFSVMILMALMGAIMEFGTFMVDGKPGLQNRLINLFGNSYLYTAEVVITLLWAYYADLRMYRDRKRLHRYVWLQYIAGVLLAVLVVNLFTGIIFYVDEHNVYHRNLGCYGYYLFFLVILILSMWEHHKYQENYGTMQFFPIWLFLGPILAGGLIQGGVYGVSIVWSSLSLGITALYICLQNQQTYIDVLTGLFNRQYMEHKMMELHQDTRLGYYGIMLDVDFFKQINDRFGHSVGDDALCETANILRRATMSDAIPFRYAGDEFIIIMRTNDETDITHMQDRIRGEMRRFNEITKEPYRLSFSMGYARYDREDSVDNFLKRMDDNMYEDKQRNHKRLLAAEGRSSE